MDLTEDQVIEKYFKQCLYGIRNSLLLFELEYACVACGHNVVQR